MVEINLLPWRTYQQLHQRKIAKKMLLFTLLFTLFTLIILHHLLSSQEMVLINHIEGLQKQILKPPKQFIKKTLPKPEVNLTTLLKELKRMTMHDVCFTEILHRNTDIVFIGKAHSAADLTDYLKNWSAALFFSEIKINKLEQKGDGVVHFRFDAMELAA